MSTESKPLPLVAWPWATAAVIVAALLVYIIPGASELLVYDRARVTQGEWWRVLTSHWVHFSVSHLFWNALVVAVAGSWAERLLPWRARILYLVAAGVIGAALHALEPSLARYGGLSGVAAGLVVFLAMVQLRRGTDSRWFWWTVLGLLVVKIVAETLLASPLLARFPDPAMRSMAIAHLAGAVAGTMALRRYKPATKA